MHASVIPSFRGGMLLGMNTMQQYGIDVLVSKRILKIGEKEVPLLVVAGWSPDMDSAPKKGPEQDKQGPEFLKGIVDKFPELLTTLILDFVLAFFVIGILALVMPGFFA